MAGYTRQSTASIINGSSITAPPINAEFNQLLAAFNASSGHGHTGGTGDAPKIPLTTSVSGYLPLAHGGVGGRNNVTNSVPGAGDDSADGYAPGSIWENSSTGRVYICVGNSSGAAVWRELVQVDSGNAILPASNDSVDLGNNSTRFQDLFLSGGISATGNVAIGGTLTTVGTSAFTGLATFANLSATGTTTITSVDLNSGAIDNAVIGSATPAAGTFTTLNANTSLVAATADINGGTIDGAALGATTPSTGSFTTLGASGTSTLATVDINGGNIDGTVIGASTKAAGSFTTLSTTGQATLASADINGGSIDGSTIGANSASTGAFTTLTASGGITGSLTGNVSGNVTGNVTGAVTGNVTGNLTGNVTSSGASSFNNVTIDGTLNMNAGTTATITNLTTPQNSGDAASKGYVDSEISALIGDAGAGLDTLGELADALNDDDDFSTTVTNSIATKLPKAGGTMSGEIAMGSNKITGVTDPTGAQDVSTKAYTDTQRDTRVAKTGDTMSGALAMGNNKITGLGTPTANADASSKQYVDGLFQSTTAAATSATNAATSETNAATSETNAGNSAAAALVSQNAAASSYDNFDDRYLGAKSSAPTVDNDGDALITGALYFNSTTNIMNVYGSGGWQSAGSAVNGTSERTTYTATAGQTVFAATYDTGYIDVYLNGVKLLVGTDFTATNGTSITLASGASVNDVVDIVAYGTFVLADHYTRTASDARYVEVAGDTMTGNLSFGTNDKAIFGAGSDLQIFHNGGNSFIQDTGVGNLYLAGSNSVLISDASASNTMATFNLNGSVDLYHSNAIKLATTSTGIDVTGTVTSDGLTVDSGAGNIGIVTKSTDQFAFIGFEDNTSSTSSVYVGADGNDFIARASSLTRFRAASNGDISFYEDTGTTAKFHWDASAERLGIGTSSPDQLLHLEGTNATGNTNPITLRFTDTDTASAVNQIVGRIEFEGRDAGASGVGSFIQGVAEDVSGKQYLSFGTGTSGSATERMRIESSGQVGIGKVPPTDTHATWSQLFLGEKGSYISEKSSSGGNYGNYVTDNLYVDSDTGSFANITTDESSAYRQEGGVHHWYSQASGSAGAAVTLSEKMRIDSSGNLLVGKTSTGLSVTGTQITSDGRLMVTRDGNQAADFNRKSSDGDIVKFQKDGATVGSIGVAQSGDRTYFSGGSYGIASDTSEATIMPCGTTGTGNDGVLNLGKSDARWKDLHLSGGVYLGGTGSANQLDDYEEGTWTPVVSGSDNAGTMNYTSRLGRYTKVGRLVTLHFYVEADQGTGSGHLLLGGAPFTIVNYHFAFGSPQWNTGISYPSSGRDANWLRYNSTSFDIRCNMDNAAFTTVVYSSNVEYLRGCITYETDA